MPDSLLLTPKEVIDFRENGMLLIRAFYDCEHEIRPIQLEIYRIIGQIMMRHGLVDNRKPCTACDFDDGYAALIAYDRTLGSEVYDAVKQIPALVRLVSSVNN